MTYHTTDQLTIARVLSFVMPQLKGIRSNSELSQRLANLGYSFRDTARGRILTTLPHGLEIAPIPSDLSRI